MTESPGLWTMEFMDFEKAAKKDMELGPSYLCPGCGEEYDISLIMICGECGSKLEYHPNIKE